MSDSRNMRLALGLGAAAIAAGLLVTMLLPAREARLRSEVETSSNGEGWAERDSKRRRHEILLRTQIAAGSWEKAHEEASALLHLDPIHEEGRAALRRARTELERIRSGEGAGTERAEGRGSRRRAFAWERASREVRELAAASIDRRHPDPSTSRAIRLFALDGRIESAADALRAIAGPEAAALLADLLALSAALQDGQAALRDGRLNEADDWIRKAIGLERKLLPEEVASTPVRDARRSVAQAWYEDGRLHHSIDQLDLALASWRRGREADPTHLDLRVSLQRAEERLAGKRNAPR